MTDRGGRAIIAIDLLRFASALLVVSLHFGNAFAKAPSRTSAVMLAGLPVRAIPGTWFGWIGVELFFVISGFVIAFSAEHAAPLDFMRRRALRLLPAAWICASVSFLVLLSAAPQPGLGAAWWRSVIFWPTGRWIDASYWTLGIEVAFYFFIATGLRGPDRARAIERRARVMGMLSLGFWLVATRADAWPMMDYRPVQLLLLPQGCCFALGILAWAMARRGMTVRRVGLAILFYAVALVDIVARSYTIGEPLTWQQPVAPIVVFTLGLGVVLAAIPLQPRLARHVSAAVAVTLGLMTYPLYLLHQEVGAAIIAAAMRSGRGFWSAEAIALAVVCALAWAIATYAEPALRLTLARFPGGRRLAAAPARSAALS